MINLRKQNTKFLSIFFTILFFGLIFLFSSAIYANAITFDEIITGAKKFVIGGDKKELNIEPEISLAPGGDITKNGKIDAGDTLRFTYTIKNTTDNEYKFATLKTNINREALSFIHAVKGSTGFSDKNKTIIFPNVNIRSQEEITISFDAVVNFYQDVDKKIATEPEFVTNEDKSILTAEKQEVTAKKMEKEKVRSLIDSSAR